jgi:hypothetical protein
MPDNDGVSNNDRNNDDGTARPATTVGWQPPRPAQIPAMHARLQDWLTHPLVLQGTCNAVAAGQGTIIPTAPTPLDAALVLHREEAARLRGAHLFAVDPQMTDQAIAAGASLPDWSVQPNDLPAQRGFVVYDRPIGSARAGEIDVPIVACSWGPSPHCAPPTGAVWLTFWSAPNLDRITDQILHATGEPEAQASAAARTAARLEAARSTWPLWWDDEALVCWSAGEPEIPLSPRLVPAQEVRGVIAKNVTLPWIRTVLATWLLITQPTIVDITEQYAPRPERRRAERAGHRLPPVRVVSLHHHAATTAPPAAAGAAPRRTVRVRFPVRGFWRDQPYGKGRALRRRTWIAEHWRGPEDAPLLNRPTVTVVNTPPQRTTGRGATGPTGRPRTLDRGL